MAKSYLIIWQRIKQNPSKGVPVDIVDGFVNRVIAAVKNEKYYDKAYKDGKAAENMCGIMYMHRAAHPSLPNIVRVTFLLREYHATNQSDVNYLKKFPPNADLVKQLGLEMLEAIDYERIGKS